MADTKITRKEVEHVAHLARLSPSEKEIEALEKDMNSILSYIEKLNELDTSGVEPTAQVAPMKTAFRQDKVGESLKREEALKNAPKTDGEFYIVPRVIED